MSAHVLELQYCSFCEFCESKLPIRLPAPILVTDKVIDIDLFESLHSFVDIIGLHAWTTATTL